MNERVVAGLVVAAACALTLLTMGRAASFLVVAWSEQRFLAFNLVWLAVFVIAGFGLARRKRVAYLVALFLAIGGGIGNGLGHLALSAREGGYFPGAYTGLVALLVGSLLAYRMMRRPAHVVREF